MNYQRLVYALNEVIIKCEEDMYFAEIEYDERRYEELSYRRDHAAEILVKVKQRLALRG